MTIAFVQSHGGDKQVASGTGLTGSNATGVAVPAGQLIVFWVLFDNTGTSTPTVSSVSDAGGNTWARIASHDSSSATSAGGVRGEMWASLLTNDWPIGAAISVTLSAAVLKRILLPPLEFSGASATLRGTAGAGTSTSGSPTSTTAGTAPASGDLVLGGGSFENNAAPTGDSDVSNGSWSTALTDFTTGGGAATNVAGCVQYKIVTGGGNQTYNPTGASDSGAAVVALQPAAPTTSAAPNQRLRAIRSQLVR